MGDEEVEQEAFAGAGGSENDRVGDVLVMEVQEIRRPVVGFKDGEILRAKMRVLAFSRVQPKEKREIRVVGVQEPQFSKIVRAVSGMDRQPCIELVVTLLHELGVMRGEHFETLRHGPPERQKVFVIENDGQRELAKGVALDLDFFQACTQVGHKRRG